MENLDDCDARLTNGDEIRLRTRCELLMRKGSWLNVRVGESRDRSVIQFPDTDRGKERCPGMTVTYTQIQLAAKITERSSHKTRLTELNTDDDEISERPSRSSHSRLKNLCITTSACLKQTRDGRLVC